MTGFKEYDAYDALGLAGLVRGGEVSADELLDEALARSDALNPTLNAVTLRFEDRARAAIEAGLPEGPFRGVPFLLKNLGASMAGTPLTNGSRLFEDFICDHDSTLVVRYVRAGLVIFGRSASPELGVSYATEPLLHGPTRNPWNLDHIPGGSSGGAAAAVAARILPIAHASDGGGSIRVPASCCGLFGLKPTRARNPSGPDAGEGWAGLGVSHAVTLSVRDSAALLDATSGPDAGDPYHAPVPARPFLDEVGAEPGRLRIAVTTDNPNDAPVHADCRAALDEAAKLCEELGHDVSEAAPAYDKEAMGDAMMAVVGANTLAAVNRRAAELGREATERDVERVTWSVARRGDTVTGESYVQATQTLHRVGRQLASFFTDHDVLLTPTLAQPPIAIGAMDMMTEDLDSYRDLLSAFAAFPSLANVTGCPAMSMPLHWNTGGLPIGAMFMAPFGDEATLLRLAAQLEAARPWFHRRPPLDGMG
jgi:amidase/6-aminohexanoate-cyclic-dimer hydrolase